MLGDKPAHLPPNESIFDISDITADPLEVISLEGAVKYDVTDYEAGGKLSNLMQDYEEKPKRFLTLKSKDIKSSMIVSIIYSEINWHFAAPEHFAVKNTPV